MADRLNAIVLDLGSTAIKAAVCDKNNKIYKVFSKAAPEVAFIDGYYCSDAMAYLSVAQQLMDQCLEYTNLSPLLGVCFQRSSLVFWDRHTGIPVTQLISWQDTSGQSCCQDLEVYNEKIRGIAGIPLTPYYFAPKVCNLLQQNKNLMQGIVNNGLLVGTLDTFLIWHWTAGKYFITDASMAARTLLMDIKIGLWSETLCDLFKIPSEVLPQIYPTNGQALKLTCGASLNASVADQSAAMLASVANDSSEVLINLGTGGFVVRYLSEETNENHLGYLKTLIFQDSQKMSLVALEGTLNSITTALKPYPYRHCKIENLAEIEDIYCISEPAGIGAPYFCPNIGLMFSKPVDHLSPEQIASLLLEGIIYRIVLILEDFDQHSAIQRVYLSGGLSALPCLQQAIAICSPVPVYRIMQQHSGLQGVLILTKNLQHATDRQSELILSSFSAKPLKSKYLHWKEWFVSIVDRNQ